MLSLHNLASQLVGLVVGPPRPPSPPQEKFSWYKLEDFYPVQIGEVLHSRYQVVGKLGHGAYSTVWLCRDLVEHRYVTIKVCTRNALPVRRELSALQHLNSLPRTRHPGRPFIRILLDQFELTLPAPGDQAASSHTDTQSANPPPPQSFQCLVHKPMLMSLFAFRGGRKLPEKFLKLVLRHVLRALDYLHSEAKVIHTDLQERNILLDLDDIAALEAFEEAERTTPVARKIAGDRVIYLSREITTDPSNYGRPMLCDFGEARFGSTTYTDIIQPYQYRAPEVILGAPWDEKVDIWTVGVMIWNMFEGRDMFKTDGRPEKKDDDLYHLAHMVSLLGSPPVDILKRGTLDELGQYFDEKGRKFCLEQPRIGATSLPDDSLEQSERNLEGEDKTLFLAFMRKMVRWKPEERCSASELLGDAWINKV
ncbi:hypothetical protein V8D89_007038 [Ganoderma adspersum]